MMHGLLIKISEDEQLYKDTPIDNIKKSIMALCDFALIKDKLRVTIYENDIYIVCTFKSLENVIYIKNRIIDRLNEYLSELSSMDINKIFSVYFMGEEVYLIHVNLQVIIEYLNLINNLTDE